jgi:hypothetical protein
MTSAKPQGMAAKTEAPDDLIAELARLMAEETAVPVHREQPAAVRIPGTPDASQAPRFDFSNVVNTPQPAPTVRIPGGDTPAPAEPAPFSFDFTPRQPKPAVPAAATPEPQPEPAPLDVDSLADLIAAELANDMSPQPAPAAEPAPRSDDAFGVAPVFGLGGPTVETPPAPTAVMVSPEPKVFQDAEPVVPVTTDALGDIKQLVGDSIVMDGHLERTVDLEPQPEPVLPPPARPALRSLATPTIPAAPQPATTSIDDAILAAAAASGAKVEWVDDAEAEFAPVRDERPAKPPRAPFRVSRAVVGPVVALTLLAVAGGGLYWVLGQGGGVPSGPAPLVVADATPVKEVPEPEATEPAPQSVVFNEISGTDTSAEEQIVSRDQADTAAVVAASNGGAASTALPALDGTGVDPSTEGLVNRKVRTVTVRPDGTIVSGDSGLAGSAILPVDRPDVPEVPGADTSTPDLVASAESDLAAAATAEPAATPTTETPAAPVAEPGSVIAVADASGTIIQGRTVTMPMSRPGDLAAAAPATTATPTATLPPPPASTTATDVAATTPAPAATPAPAETPPASGSAAAYVQLSSQRTEDAARESAQAIATRYGVLFGGADLQIQRVDLGERGIYYRVLVPAQSRENANNICTNVKAAGGDCLLL